MVRNGQDLGSGLLFIAIGGVGLWWGREYELGTTANMGPGFVPMALSGILVLMGLAIGLRACRGANTAIDRVHWRPVLLLTLAMLAFAGLIRTAGFAPAIVATVIVAALASRESRAREFVPLSIALAVVCVLVFVVALRQPVAIFGAS